MFYLTKRIDERQCLVGDRCMVLADFSGIPAGTKGTVCDIYDGGLTILWQCEEFGEKHPEDHGQRRDGFGRDELEYLAFETKAHPNVDPRVSNTNDQ